MASYRESFIVYIACDPPAIFWTGHGPLRLPADAVLPTDVVAPGAGELVSIPDFQQLMDGTAERLQFVFSGVSDRTLDLAFEEAESVRNALVYLGRIDFGPDWQPLGPVEWEAMFQARELLITRDGSGDQATQSLSFTLASGDTARSKSPNAFWTDADQRRKSPTDTIGSHVAGITMGTSRRWGPR